MTCSEEISLTLTKTKDTRGLVIFVTVVQSLVSRLSGILGNFDGVPHNDLVAMRGAKTDTYSTSDLNDNLVHNIMSTC